ncbi:Flp pilus assembly pilin Flp [Nocardioides daedukensis]|jgi:Flp pilus assembly pilin Flp|uniref:Flp pilus assembly pilin Flp n=1 Tax=Nocardioides daedukensis TaxID=634462 RepID=A0A7Y9UVM9_9ACTN|nr:Flp family type IVb pilin [Nocardioides daedukensis]NYG58035.1 Flp pilus assembly pilin Flp [Nocardioides daedukensis]
MEFIIRGRSRHLEQGELVNDESGATAVEYALLLALVAAVIFGALQLFGGAVAGLFTLPDW